MRTTVCTSKPDLGTISIMNGRINSRSACFGMMQGIIRLVLAGLLKERVNLLFSRRLILSGSPHPHFQRKLGLSTRVGLQVVGLRYC